MSWSNGKITGKLFPKQKPKFLKGLEYDGYNNELKMAVEYDGIQHYKPVKQFGGEKGFIKTQKRDAKKEKMSKLNKIILIRVPYMVTNFEFFFEELFLFYVKNFKCALICPSTITITKS